MTQGQINKINYLKSENARLREEMEALRRKPAPKKKAAAKPAKKAAPRRAKKKA